jgi:hypothetical protein
VRRTGKELPGRWNVAGGLSRLSRLQTERTDSNGIRVANRSVGNIARFETNADWILMSRITMRMENGAAPSARTA